MHMIEAIIKPERLEMVKTALKDLSVQGLTAVDVQGYGRQMGETETYRGAQVAASFRHKVLIKVAVSTAQSDAVINAVVTAARSGDVGDGKIFVYPIAQIIRIRTGERDGDAL